MEQGVSTSELDTCKTQVGVVVMHRPNDVCHAAIVRSVGPHTASRQALFWAFFRHLSTAGEQTPGRASVP